MDMTEMALGVLVASVVVIGVVIPVTNSVIVTDTETQEDTFTSSGSLPEVFTLSQVQDGVVENSETVTFVNTTGDSSEIELTESDYTIDYDTGELNISNVEGATPESGDEFVTSYSYKPQGYIDSTITRTVVENVTLVISIGVLVFVFSMVRGM